MAEGNRRGRLHPDSRHRLPARDTKGGDSNESSPQSSLRLGIWTVEEGGNPDGWEQAPPAHGPRRFAGAGKSGSKSARRSLGLSTARSARELAAPVGWSQGCVQPAGAFAGSAMVAAVNTAQQHSHLQRNALVIANGRLENCENAWKVHPKDWTSPESRFGSTSDVAFQT
jgi:hypothetical protein